MKDLLADPSLKPGSSEIKAALRNLRDLLRIRYSSPLFRLRTAALVQERVEFLDCGPEALPGVITMSIKDGQGDSSLDPNYRRMVVVFNARPDGTTVMDESLKDASLTLHPVLASSPDPFLRQVSFEASAGSISVPARTTAVLVEKR